MHPEQPWPSPLPPDLVAERQRIRRLAAVADQRADRGRLRRRALVPAAVASGVLVSTGLIGAWARATTPSPSTTAGQSASTAAPAAAALSSEQTFLGELRRTLSADRQAVAGLPKVAASAFATSAAATPATGSGAAPAPAPVATLPPISLPAISAPPPVHATTGASGIP